jgi:serpin B
MLAGSIGRAGGGSTTKGNRIAVAGAILMAIVLAACTGATATPVASLEASPSDAPTLAPTPNPTPEPTPTLGPTETPTPSALPSSSAAPVQYTVLMGKAKLLTPAADNGVVAARELNDFGFDLLRLLDPSGNMCVSPSSIALALAMVRPGARGSTAAELDKVLHGLGTDANAAELVALLKELEADTIYVDAQGLPLDPGQTPAAGQQPVVELRVSNAAFLQKDMPVLTAYLDALSSRFGAGVGQLDFAASPESARLTINKWASDRTNGRIPNVLQPGDITSNTRFALANAIYFKAAWKVPFEASATSSQPFHLANGTTVSVPTMKGELATGYATGTGWRAINLYYTGFRTSMTVIVPDNMASFAASLNASKLASIVSAERAYEVDFTLPRFSTETRLSLADQLEQLGLSGAFDPSAADLSGITGDRQLFLDRVIHQANIDVVEQGTTAAAVTVVAGAGAAGPPPHVVFHVDKPFLYFIQDRASGAVLFMGRIDDPSQK